MSEHYSAGGLLRPGTVTLTVVDHPSTHCDDGNHIHTDECILGPDMACRRADQMHRDLKHANP